MDVTPLAVVQTYLLSLPSIQALVGADGVYVPGLPQGWVPGRSVSLRGAGGDDRTGWPGERPRVETAAYGVTPGDAFAVDSALYVALHDRHGIWVVVNGQRYRIRSAVRNGGPSNLTDDQYDVPIVVSYYQVEVGQGG